MHACLEFRTSVHAGLHLARASQHAFLCCLAGLIKVLLSFEHGLLPPNLHFSEPNPDSKGLLEGTLKVESPRSAVLAHYTCTCCALQCMQE